MEPYIISQLYITKQLEYFTKDYLAMHTILLKLKTALFFSFLVVYVTVLNNIILLITQSRLYVAQASSSFKHLDTGMLTHTTSTFTTEEFHLVTYVRLF